MTKLELLEHDAASIETAPAAVTTNTNNDKEVSTFHDLLAGGVAGSASVIVGHPFDTIKVRLQCGEGMSVASKGHGGLKSLFSGIGAPLSTTAVINAIIFAGFGFSSRCWDAYRHQQTPHHNAVDHEGSSTVHGVVSSDVGAVLIIEDDPHHHSPPHTQYAKNFVCGSVAGFIQSFIVCPMEHIKCRLQVQSKGVIGTTTTTTTTTTKTVRYNGAIDATHQIFANHGWKGLYRGMATTCWREVPGFGIYFCSYDLVRDSSSSLLLTGSKKEQQQNNWISSMLAGGIAGSITWACTYPFDVIKSRVQTAPLEASPESLHMKAVARSIIATEGLGALYRGLGVTLARAFPVNAIIFPVYEWTLKLIT